MRSGVTRRQGRQLLTKLLLPITVLATVVFAASIIILITWQSDSITKPDPAVPITLDVFVHNAADGPIHQGDLIRIESTRCVLVDQPIIADVLAVYEPVNQESSDTLTLVAADGVTLDPGCESSTSDWTLLLRVVPGKWRIKVEYTEAGQEIAIATSNDFEVLP